MAKIVFFLFLLVVRVYASDFDPNNITVEDPTKTFFAELPSGDVDLKTYHATQALIDTYSKLFKVQGGDLKDFPKAPNCTRAEIDALKHWTTNAIYQEVNRALRTVQKGDVEGAPLSSKIETEILMISSAVNCAPQYTGPVVRMENTPPVIMAQYKVGSHILSRSFTSATKGSKPTEYFLQLCTQEIFIPKAQGADVDSLGITPWPDEHEVLIRPGTVFKVTGRKDFPAGSHHPFNTFSFLQP